MSYFCGSECHLFWDIRKLPNSNDLRKTSNKKIPREHMNHISRIMQRYLSEALHICGNYCTHRCMICKRPKAKVLDLWTCRLVKHWEGSPNKSVFPVFTRFLTPSLFGYFHDVSMFKIGVGPLKSPEGKHVFS